MFLRKGVEIREARVESVWLFRGDPVFKLASVDSMTAAETLAGFDVCVPAAERAPLEEGEYFFSDIVGCEAVSFENGEPYGRVAGWSENGPGQVWFEVDDGGKTFLVPYHKAIFREIDVAAKRVRLELPEGLRDLN